MSSFVLPIISGLAGLFGSGQKQKTETNQQTSGTQNQSFGSSGSSTPNLNPFQQRLAEMFTKGATDQFSQGTNFAPYTSAGIQSIAGQGQQNNKMISNILAQRGLSYSPAAATGLTQNALNTGNQIQGFQQQIPLLQHQLQQGNLDQLMKAFATQPYGTSTTGEGSSQGQTSGTTSGTSTQSTPGGGLSGLFGGFGAGLAGPQSGGGSNLDSILKMFGLGGGGSPGMQQGRYGG